MTLPGAISTCTVTYGSALTFLGAVSSIEARLTADRSVVWSATGQSLNSGDDLVTAVDGSALSFVVPHVNQSGFVDANSDAVTLWYYRLVGTVTFSTGTTMAFAKNFQVLVGQTNVDLDLIDDNATVLPAVVVVGDPVTSVVGETGIVTAEQIAAALALPDTYVRAVNVSVVFSDNPITVTSVPVDAHFGLVDYTLLITHDVDTWAAIRAIGNIYVGDISTQATRSVPSFAGYLEADAQWIIDNSSVDLDGEGSLVLTLPTATAFGNLDPALPVPTSVQILGTAQWVDLPS